MTEAEYQAYQARRAVRRSEPVTQINTVGCEQEAKLHQQIIEHANSHLWICFHGSMAHRTYRVPGEPDFIIALPGGKTIYVECKTRTGKLTKEQWAVKHNLESFGHTYLIVRSFAEFLELVKQV